MSDDGGQATPVQVTIAETSAVLTRAEPEVVYEGDLDLDQNPFEEGPARRVEQTRAKFAYLMLALLASVILGMFVLLFADKVTPEEFSGIAGVLISPIVGLLGAATGYYYGRGDR